MRTRITRRVQGQTGQDTEAALGSGPDLHLPAQRLGAFAHALDPAPGAALARQRALAVVVDFERQFMLGVGEPNHGRFRRGVADDVGERLLQDAEGGQVDQWQAVDAAVDLGPNL